MECDFVMKKDDFSVAVVGLGYVGLPLAVALAKHFKLTGFDLNQSKISSLKSGKDPLNELSDEELKAVNIAYCSDPSCLKECNFIIVAVPTPVTKANLPDLTPITKASEMVGKNLRSGSTVIFESTVYPGVTEEVALPIIEQFSNLKCGSDWFIGYSPERINPGDREHTIDKITKIVSGMDNETLEKAAFVYGAITKVHKAESIKVAEAAKVIENIQRDLNIGLMNELSKIFRRLDIDTQEVLKAAGTKWNFHNYKPGLVGGHCIGVDPYYLTHKAQELGYHPRIILAGRELNDGMAKYVAENTIKLMINAGQTIKAANVLILGLTFKENVKDSRNSKVKDVIAEIKSFGASVEACDPYLSQEELDHEGFGVKNKGLSSLGKYDAVILAVPHKEFAGLSLKSLDKLFKEKKVLIDIKGFYDKEEAKRLGFEYFRL
ncbi:nucleotide sugar dehydrogenase [Candidatus Woesearchaeota archaeon]|nr:nucleotide sugar dehydrogenase [Candidatus Woesearchaeota archaeon]